MVLAVLERVPTLPFQDKYLQPPLVMVGLQEQQPVPALQALTHLWRERSALQQSLRLEVGLAVEKTAPQQREVLVAAVGAWEVKAEPLEIQVDTHRQKVMLAVTAMVVLEAVVVEPDKRELTDREPATEEMVLNGQQVLEPIMQAVVQIQRDQVELVVVVGQALREGLTLGVVVAHGMELGRGLEPVVLAWSLFATLIRIQQQRQQPEAQQLQCLADTVLTNSPAMAL